MPSQEPHYTDVLNTQKQFWAAFIASLTGFPARVLAHPVTWPNGADR